MLLIFAGLLLAAPGLLLIGLVCSVASVLRQRLPLDVAVPAAGLGILVVSVAAGVLASLLGVDLLARPWLLGAAYLASGLAALAVATRRHPRSPDPRAVAGLAWFAIAPATVAVGTGLLQSVSVGVAKSWSFWGTDLVHHMMLVSQVQADGRLSYATTGYPRGAHMLAALVSVPTVPLDDRVALMGYDLRLTAALSWFALALMLWTGAALTVRLGRALGLPSGIPETAALALGTGALLTNTFLESFIYMGASPSLLAVAVLWALPLAAVTSPRLLGRLPLLAVVCCAAAMLLAHLWQALAVVPAVALAVCVAARPRDVLAGTRDAGSWRHLLRFVPWAAGSLAIAALPMIGIQQAGGVGLAATQGDLPEGPWHLLLPALLVLVPLARQARELWARLALGSVAGLVVVTALIVHGASHGFDLDQYYPLKTLWFLTLFLAPGLALGATWLALTVARPAWRAAAGAGSVAFALRASVVGLVAALAFVGWLPWLLGTGSGTVDAWRGLGARDTVGQVGPQMSWSAHRYDLAARYGPALAPAVVVPYYVGSSGMVDGFSTSLVSELLSFQTGQVALPGDAKHLCSAIATVAGAADAVVISKLPAAQVRRAMARDGCAGRAAVVRVPGGILNPPRSP